MCFCFSYSLVIKTEKLEVIDSPQNHMVNKLSEKKFTNKNDVHHNLSHSVGLHRKYCSLVVRNFEFEVRPSEKSVSLHLSLKLDVTQRNPSNLGNKINYEQKQGQP